MQLATARAVEVAAINAEGCSAGRVPTALPIFLRSGFLLEIMS